MGTKSEPLRPYHVDFTRVCQNFLCAFPHLVPPQGGTVRSFVNSLCWMALRILLFGKARAVY
jgi:hypothetical protein